MTTLAPHPYQSEMPSDGNSPADNDLFNSEVREIAERDQTEALYERLNSLPEDIDSKKLKVSEIAEATGSTWKQAYEMGQTGFSELLKEARTWKLDKEKEGNTIRTSTALVPYVPGEAVLVSRSASRPVYEVPTLPAPKTNNALNPGASVHKETGEDNFDSMPGWLKAAIDPNSDEYKAKDGQWSSDGYEDKFFANLEARRKRTAGLDDEVTAFQEHLASLGDEDESTAVDADKTKDTVADLAVTKVSDESLTPWHTPESMWKEIDAKGAGRLRDRLSRGYYRAAILLTKTQTRVGEMVGTAVQAFSKEENGERSPRWGRIAAVGGFAVSLAGAYIVIRHNIDMPSSGGGGRQVAADHMPKKVPETPQITGPKTITVVPPPEFSVEAVQPHLNLVVEQGDAPWNVLQHAGVDPSEIMDKLNGAAERLQANTGTSFEWQGSGKRQFLKVGGETNTQRVIDQLKPYL